MASTKVTPDADTWTLLSSAVDFLVQNVGEDVIYVTFSAILPTGSVSANAVHELYPGQAIVRNTLTGNLYGYSARSTTEITVSE